MVGNKHLFKHFSTPSVERQVLDIADKNVQKLVENKVAEVPHEELFIAPLKEESVEVKVEVLSENLNKNTKKQVIKKKNNKTKKNNKNI